MTRVLTLSVNEEMEQAFAKRGIAPAMMRTFCYASIRKELGIHSDAPANAQRKLPSERSRIRADLIRRADIATAMPEGAAKDAEIHKVLTELENFRKRTDLNRGKTI